MSDESMIDKIAHMAAENHAEGIKEQGFGFQRFAEEVADVFVIVKQRITAKLNPPAYSPTPQPETDAPTEKNDHASDAANRRTGDVPNSERHIN